MNISDILGAVGVVVGLAGLIYAIYQTHERQKLKEFVRSQSWYVYSKANNVTGIAQASLRKYKEVHAQDHRSEVIEFMAKNDAFGQDLFRETIRQIQLSEPEFSRNQIAIWIAEGKVDKDHAQLFEQICLSETPSNKSLTARILAKLMPVKPEVSCKRVITTQSAPKPPS